MSATLTVASTSIASNIADIEANLSKAKGVIAEAASRGAEIIVFPETYLTGYACGEEGKFFELAEPIPGPSTTALVEQANKYNIYIATGLVEQDQEYCGIIHNSAVFLGPEGILQVHRKVHLGEAGVFTELHYGFSPGDQFSVFRIRQNWNIGMSICYDTFFPEGPRLMAIKGMDVLITMSAAPDFTRERWELINRARATENNVFHVYSNVVGTQGELVFFGGAMIISPGAGFLAKGKVGAEDLIVAKLDVRELLESRKMRFYLRDRRPRAYQGII